MSVHGDHEHRQSHIRDTDRQTETERQRKKTEKEEETKENKTRHEKREERREKIHFQCGGAWPFLVDVVLCLVLPVSDRFFSLLNRVKCDCSLMSFIAPWQVNSFFISPNYFIYAVAVFNFF